MTHWILLAHSFLPGDFGRQMAAFVDDQNNARYHGNLGNLTPAMSVSGALNGS